MDKIYLEKKEPVVQKVQKRADNVKIVDGPFGRQYICPYPSEHLNDAQREVRDYYIRKK